MYNSNFIHFLILFNIYISDAKENSFYSKLIHKSIANIEKQNGGKEINLKCSRENQLLPNKFQARFVDQSANSLFNNNKMEAPTAKFSIMNLLSDFESQDEDDNDYNDSEDNVKDGDAAGNGGGGLNFGTKDSKEESLLKQYHRQSLRLHNLVFPLLLAYKLKFSMVIPLLLGSLVLLVGTTGIAGFFFALFAAAMGIQVKNQEH